MKKRILLPLVLLFALCLLLSCREEYERRVTTVNCTSAETDRSFSSRYDHCDGVREYPVKISDGEGAALSVAFQTESGSYRLTVTAPDGSEVYSGNELAPSGFTLHLDALGTYRVRIEFDNHKGGYAFSW